MDAWALLQIHFRFEYEPDEFEYLNIFMVQPSASKQKQQDGSKAPPCALGIAINRIVGTHEHVWNADESRFEMHALVFF